ncbi:MAG: LacI family DNA-binding transcriptional regulator [Gammaproteobacteria bacterium]|nr:LacI family DNA-binding transcriptional regulator [Gammaproteobacteria bacterium]
MPAVKRGGKGPVTIDDVAASAGVSIKTVSRVLNHEPNVREATRARVRQAVEQLNYRPNPSARSLAGNRADIIGLAYDNPSDSYITNVLHGALGACQEFDYSLLLNPCDYRDPCLPQQITQLIENRRLAGLILTPPVSDVAELLRVLDQLEITYVSIAPIDRERPGLYVVMNDRAGARDMTLHLIELGHRRIGFVKGHPDHGASHHRFQGYCDALRQSGIAITDELVVQGMFSFESGLECGERLLCLTTRPTAVFASNDDMAAGILHLAHQRGIRVPEELSIVGYDDTPLSRVVWPSLTTLRQPIQEMARAAVEQLVAILRPNHAGLKAHAPHETLRYELVVRQSACPPPAGARRPPRDDA